MAFAFAALVVSIQSLWQGVNIHGYTAFENYVIFKRSFLHLIEGLNPYAAFPAEQWDLYKYSPAFALAMAPFAGLPDWLGLPLWNLLNALPLLWALLRIPLLEGHKRCFLAWFVLPELVISMQNSQSNGLTAALLLWALVDLEKRRPGRAAGWTAAGGFLKIFGIFAAAPALVYPGRRSFFLSLALWCIMLVLAPLLVAAPGHAVELYRWWGALLQADHSHSVGLSVQGWLQTWFGWEAPKWGVMLVGISLLAASVWQVARQPGTHQRLLLWASLLLWVVVFNHKAESPTFIIALCGAGLWYWGLDKPLRWETALLALAFITASVSPTDIFPRSIREQYVQPYVLKAAPCILIWIYITLHLLHLLPQDKQQLTFDE